MSFVIETLQLEQFRNWESAEFSFDTTLTILAGPNAVGKTNIIEALQLLTEGTSFRRAHMSEYVHWGEVFSRAQLFAHDGQRRREVVLTIEENKRSFEVNNKTVRGPREVAGEIPCVVFTPNDLRIVKESSSRRREEIDALGSQLSLTYAKLRSEYDKIVSQRNKLLKAELFDDPVLEAWTNRLVEVGCALFNKRHALFQRIRPAFVEAACHISPNGEPSLDYFSSWAEVEHAGDEQALQVDFRKALESGSEKERGQRLSVVGPQRDDLVFSLDGRPTRSFGSQGQQRSLALAWKLAEISVVEEIAQRRPLLLLDDVMSELDEMRRGQLAEMVGNLTQTVITTANLDYFDKTLLSRATVVKL